MPKIAKELTALEVKRLAHPGHAGHAKFPVGGVPGLLLQITQSGGRSWQLRTMIAGKRRVIGLGAFPTLSLAQARERAREVLVGIRRGIDPIEERKVARAALAAAQARGLTFDAAAEQFLEGKVEEFRNAKHAAQWRSTLSTYASPALGDMLVDDIRVADVQRALVPIWLEKTETATRVRGRIEAVLSWATVAGHREGDNPARWKGNLDALLPKPSKVAKVTNHPALALGDAAEWFSNLRKREGMAARALEFAALTAARSGEVRGATWDEIDLHSKLWTISAERMKAGREHRVPLTAKAISLLKSLSHEAGNNHVFPAPRGGVLSDMSLSAVMRRMQKAAETAAVSAGVSINDAGWRDPRSGRPAVPHGLRSTFRDWAAERTEFPREMAELALAHDVGSAVERAYRRGDMVERRRALMSAWARFLENDIFPSVIPLREHTNE